MFAVGFMFSFEYKFQGMVVTKVDHTPPPSLILTEDRGLRNVVVSHNTHQAVNECISESHNISYSVSWTTALL